MGPLTGGGGGSQCHMSIFRNHDVALSNSRNEHVTLSNLRNSHVPCHYLLKPHAHVTNSTAAKGCFWEMTPTGSITRYHLFFLIEDTMGYVESVVVEKIIWSRI